MNHTALFHYSLFLLPFAFVGCATLPTVLEKNDAKNVCDIRWETFPADCERLVSEETDRWDFNFRPYGRTSDLVSDPAIIRGVAEGGEVKASATALRVACDANGWGYLVFCAEPKADEKIAAGEEAPLPNLEMYFLEKDTDNQDPAVYWQFYTGNGKLEQYDWMSEGRDWRMLKPFVRHEIRRARDGYVFRLDVPWESMWDRLPIFSDRNDNFWRIQVMRWSGGGLTWGGEVHEPARGGYMRWPAFTDAQKLAIMQTVLDKAWRSFKGWDAEARYSVMGSNKPSGWDMTAVVRTEPYAIDQVKAEGSRTYVNYAEDPAFRPVLEKLHAERVALGAGISGLAKMSPGEREAFYKKATPMLFNYRLDVEAAYAAHLKDKMLEEGK